MGADLDRRAGAEDPDPDPYGLSWFTDDLLVMGYLSAVARELDHRGVAESRLRIGSPDDAQLAGSLDLEPTRLPCWWSSVALHWHEASGWSALLRRRRTDIDPHLTGDSPGKPSGRTADRRYLHPHLVPPPQAVAEFVAELATGRDAGMIYPTAANDYGHNGSRTRVIATLTRYALPEVRSWLTTDSTSCRPPAPDYHRSTGFSRLLREASNEPNQKS